MFLGFLWLFLRRSNRTDRVREEKESESERVSECKQKRDKFNACACTETTKKVISSRLVSRFITPIKNKDVCEQQMNEQAMRARNEVHRYTHTRAQFLSVKRAQLPHRSRTHTSNVFACVSCLAFQFSFSSFVAAACFAFLSLIRYGSVDLILCYHQNC